MAAYEYVGNLCGIFCRKDDPGVVGASLNDDFRFGNNVCPELVYPEIAHVDAVDAGALDVIESSKRVIRADVTRSSAPIRAAVISSIFCILAIVTRSISVFSFDGIESKMGITRHVLR